MNLTSMLKLITIIGWVLGQAKPETDEEKDLQKKMNDSLLEIFAEVLSESNDPDFVCGVLDAATVEDGREEAKQAALDEIREAVEEANAADKANAES